MIYKSVVTWPPVIAPERGSYRRSAKKDLKQLSLLEAGSKRSPLKARVPLQFSMVHIDFQLHPFNIPGEVNQSEIYNPEGRGNQW
jgi:hypothetical protein